MNWLPRVFRNVLNGVTGGVVSRTLGLPPSQLISRRPLRRGPGLLPLTVSKPRTARNALTVLRIDSGVGPAAWNTAGATKGWDGVSCACAACPTGNSTE